MEPVGAGTLGLQAPAESVMGEGYHSTEYLLLPLFFPPCSGFWTSGVVM